MFFFALNSAILLASATTTDAYSYIPLPMWKSETPAVVHSTTQIAERLILVGEQTSASGGGNCWMAMLDSFDDDLDSIGSETFSSPFQSQGTRCSLVGVDTLHGEMVLLGVEQEVFLQLGESIQDAQTVPTRGMPIGLLADDRSNIIIVASSTPAAQPGRYQDLYLHAYRRMGDRAADLLLVWEQTFEDLIGPEESFAYAGMAISNGVLTVTGSTTGLPNVSTSSTPMNKSMMSFYARFASIFSLQMDLETGEPNNPFVPWERINRANDLNEYALDMCQDPSDKNIAYIVGQVVDENASGASPQVTKVQLFPLEVLWSNNLDDLQAAGTASDISYVALNHCIVSPETGDVFVAGVSSPDLPSRHNASPTITDPEPVSDPMDFEEDFEKDFEDWGNPIGLSNAESTNTPTCTGGRIYDDIFDECICPDDQEFVSGTCYPFDSPCLNDPCSSDQTCEHIPPEFSFEVPSYRCSGEGGSPISTMNSISTNCAGGKIYNLFLERCECPDDQEEEYFSGRCYPFDSPCLEAPCGPNEVCEHVPDDFGIDEISYWCSQFPFRSLQTSKYFPVPTQIVVGKISPTSSAVIWSEVLDSDMYDEQLAGLQIDEFSQHPLVIGNNVFDDMNSDAFVMTLHSDDGSVLQDEPVSFDEEEFSPTDCTTGGKIYDEFFDECTCPEDMEEEFLTGQCYSLDSPCFDRPCSSSLYCVHVPADDPFDDASYECVDVDVDVDDAIVVPSGTTPDSNDPIWMHQDVKDQLGSPEQAAATSSTTVEKEAEPSKTKLLTIIFGIVGGILVCFFLSLICINGHRQRRQENNQKRVMNIFSYLHPFDVDDIDIKKSPAGGFLGTYKNDLAHGEEGAAVDASSISGSDDEHTERKIV